MSNVLTHSDFPVGTIVMDSWSDGELAITEATVAVLLDGDEVVDFTDDFDTALAMVSRGALRGIALQAGRYGSIDQAQHALDHA